MWWRRSALCLWGMRRPEPEIGEHHTIPGRLGRSAPTPIGVPFVDWKAKVELFEQLRREHEFGVGTIAGVAAKFGVQRRVVSRAIASALPASAALPGAGKAKARRGRGLHRQGARRGLSRATQAAPHGPAHSPPDTERVSR